MNKNQFLNESWGRDCVIVVTSESPSALVEFPIEVCHILMDFSDITPDELPDKFYPLRNIQHSIDLMSGFNIT